jgi:hypothetical protein
VKFPLRDSTGELVRWEAVTLANRHASLSVYVDCTSLKLRLSDISVKKIIRKSFSTFEKTCSYLSPNREELM